MLTRQSGTARRRASVQESSVEPVVTTSSTSSTCRPANAPGRATANKSRTFSQRPAEERVVFAFYKPRGVMCTASDPQGRATIMDYFKDVPYRLYSVGRLDYDSEGLLLMTNDGELAYKLTHPKFTVDKTYHAVCDGVLTNAEIARLEQGVDIGDGMTSPAKITQVHALHNGNTSFDITIHEGRNRQIRRMLEAVGHQTLVLKRTKEGAVSIGFMQSGEYRALSAEELNALRQTELS